jgi:hypothetical protein
MAEENNNPRGKPYIIKLDGHLDKSWADWFDGMEFTYGSDNTTLITGEIVDDAALHGMLKKIRDLGLTLLSVNALELNQVDIKKKEKIMKRPVLVWLLVLVLFLLSLGGFSGGIPMLADPDSGGYLDFSNMLPLLPVNNFILPGLFLTFFMGLYPLILVYGLIARPVWQLADKLSKWSGHYWAWTGTILLSIGIAIWLGYEGWLVGWWPITYITAVQGVLILLLALFPNVRKFYQNQGEIR